MNRKVLVPVLVIGLLLVIAPFAISLPSKAAAGQRMLDDFHPLMQADQVKTTADYYDNVFVPLGQITPAFTDENAAKFEGYLQGLQQSGVQLPAAAMQDFESLIGMMKQAVPIAQRVPPGLAHYEPLVRTMEGNVEDYKSVDSLPSFDLFTWFFVVPGVLLVLLAGWGLWEGRSPKRAPERTAAPVA